VENIDSLPLLHALVDNFSHKPLFYWQHGLLRQRFRGINANKTIHFAARLLPHELLADPKQSSSDGTTTEDLPLHLAIQKKNHHAYSYDCHSNAHNIRTILRACPEAAHVTNNQGLLPLELALSKKPKQLWDVVSDILEASKGVVNAVSGCNVMHMIASSTRLLDYLNQGFHMKYRPGGSPENTCRIHCHHHKLLLQVTNHACLLPLHCAILNNETMSWRHGIKDLYDAFPETVKRPHGTSGFYPFCSLHLLLPTNDRWQTINKTAPAAATTTTTCSQ
jgi:hypothetical protein